MQAVQQAGIITGKPKHRFAPKDKATRLQAARMLAMLLQIGTR
ncbi:S-layer homology domain-containing protein [Paenibacillus gansuensis]|uniref:S-layer homology domain-containing protein n=1 Tax=Paenibacillus gansuensis TaxID=306542 RepID=A0ABW5P825_9BACL